MLQMIPSFTVVCFFGHEHQTLCPRAISFVSMSRVLKNLWIQYFLGVTKWCHFHPTSSNRSPERDVIFDVAMTFAQALGHSGCARNFSKGEVSLGTFASTKLILNLRRVHSVSGCSLRLPHAVLAGPPGVLLQPKETSSISSYHPIWQPLRVVNVLQF